MKTKLFSFYKVLLVLLMMVGMKGWGQVNMTTTGSYTQDFNTLINTGTSGTWSDNSTIADWYSQRTGNGTTIVPGTGTSNAGNLYSFGVAASNTERALGTIGSGNAAIGNFAHGLLLKNTSTNTITDLTISYSGEQWRVENAIAQTVYFYYKISNSAITNLNPNLNTTWTAVTALDFTSPKFSIAATNLDGNAAANRIVKTDIAIPNLNLAVGDYIMLKWEDPDHTGADHGLAIDDVTIKWTVANTSVPVLAITGIADFGSAVCVGSPVLKTFTIKNTGAAASGIKVESSDPQFVVSNLSSTSIGSGGTATYDVTFTPSSAGSKTATITVTSTTTGSNSPTSNLSGTGLAQVAPAVSIAASANPVCSGAVSNITFTPTASNLGGGIVSYQWLKNGGNVGTGATYVLNTPVDGDKVSCVATIIGGCVTTNTAASNEVVVIVNPKPVAPATPESNSPQCGSVTVKYATGQTAPNGETWYWQTTATGTATAAVNSGVTYSTNTSGTVYLRSKNNTTGCWSDASSVAVVVQSPPAFITQPTNQTVVLGSPATFSVVVANVSNVASYQWQVNTGSGFTNITGAQSASYSIPATDISMNNSKYQVIVTGFAPCSSITSNEATLFVASVPCLNENFDSNSPPTGWDYSTVNFTSFYVDMASNNGYLTTPAITYPTLLTFDLARTNNTTAKTLFVEVSTTSQTAGFSTIATYDHNNTTFNSTTSISIDLSAYTSSSTVYVRLRKASSTTSPWRIDNMKVYCAGSTNSFANDHFRTSRSGNWTDVKTWESSHNGTTWMTSDLFPTENASSVDILNGHEVLINTTGVSISKTKVFGKLKVTDYNFGVTGVANAYELSIENGGEILVEGLGFASTGNAYGLVKSGGKMTVGNISITGFSDNIMKNYLDVSTGLFSFGNGAICDWTNQYSYPSSNGYPNIFFRDNITDLPIFRISSLPVGQGYGNGSNSNIINAILEVNSVNPFNFQSNTSKTVIGGLRGTGVINIASTSGDLILGDANIVAILDGTITVNIQPAKLKLSNGANVPTGANVKIKAPAENTTFVRESGKLKIDGILDISNVRITNSESTGNVTVNGTLRTSNTGGLYGNNSAIPSGTLLINDSSTIDYYADLDQAITTSLNYYNIIFSGNGKKTPNTSNPVNVNISGNVKITGNPIVDFSSNNLASLGTNNTSFTMDSGRLILGTTGTQPNMRGVYKLTGGVIEYANSSATEQTIRNKTFTNTEDTAYQNIDISGSNVGNSSGTIGLNANGVFTVKKDAVFRSSFGNASIIGTDTTAKLIVESNGRFKTEVIPGFYGQSGGFGNPSPSVRNNISVELQTGSFVEYSRSGDQDITNKTLEPNHPDYANLTISGSGIKTINADTTVKEVTNVQSAELLIKETLEDATPIVFTASKGIAVTPGAIFRLANNAQLMQNETNDINSGKIIAERKVYSLNNVNTQMDYVYWSAPVIGQILRDAGPSSGWFSPNTPANRFFQYNESDDYFVPTPDTSFLLGKGYAIRAEAGFANPYAKTYQFTGIPNNGILNSAEPLAKSINGAGYNLVGNPYPSNIDLDKFFALNQSSIYSVAMMWTNNSFTANQQGSGYSGNNYAVYNRTGGNPATQYSLGFNVTNNIIKIGQGFIVQAQDGANGTKLKFDHSIRKPVKGTFYERNNIEKDRYWVQLISPTQVVNTMLVGYMDGATANYDNDYDSELPVLSSDAIYSKLGTLKLGIDGRSAFQVDDKVLLGNQFASAGNYKFTLAKAEGIFNSGQQIYLKDNFNNSYVNLQEGDYTFQASKGLSEGRFEIVYKPGIVLSAGNATDDELVFYKDAEDFVIRSKRKKITQVEIYDTSGRLLKKIIDNKDVMHINFLNMSAGVYIFKIGRGSDISMKKVVR